jgi:hypothetical protein
LLPDLNNAKSLFAIGDEWLPHLFAGASHLLSGGWGIRALPTTRGIEMKLKSVIAASAVVLSVSLAGCASDGSLALSTGSIGESANAAESKIDPVCVTLMARIDQLRKEGTPERLAKIATGKTKTANVKREALARMTELDKANAEFQQKCSTLATPAPAKPTASPKAAAGTASQPDAKKAAAAAKPSNTAAKTGAETTKTASAAQ